MRLRCILYAHVQVCACELLTQFPLKQDTIVMHAKQQIEPFSHTNNTNRLYLRGGPFRHTRQVPDMPGQLILPGRARFCQWSYATTPVPEEHRQRGGRGSVHVRCELLWRHSQLMLAMPCQPCELILCQWCRCALTRAMSRYVRTCCMSQYAPAGMWRHAVQHQSRLERTNADVARS